LAVAAAATPPRYSPSKPKNGSILRLLLRMLQLLLIAAARQVRRLLQQALLPLRGGGRG
jgi:hypothetical protein